MHAASEDGEASVRTRWQWIMKKPGRIHDYNLLLIIIDTETYYLMHTPGVGIKWSSLTWAWVSECLVFVPNIIIINVYV